MTVPTEEERQRAALSLELCREDVHLRTGAQQAFSEEALKALLLVNGGAMVALFTLVGAVASKGAPLHLIPERLWLAFAAFTAGLFCTLLTYLFAFLSQGGAYVASLRNFQNNVRIAAGGEAQVDVDPLFATANRRWITAIVAAVISSIAFVVGAGFALAGFLPA